MRSFLLLSVLAVSLFCLASTVKPISAAEQKIAEFHRSPGVPEEYPLRWGQVVHGAHFHFKDLVFVANEEYIIKRAMPKWPYQVYEEMFVFGQHLDPILTTNLFTNEVGNMNGHFQLRLYLDGVPPPGATISFRWMVYDLCWQRIVYETEWVEITF